MIDVKNAFLHEYKVGRFFWRLVSLNILSFCESQYKISPERMRYGTFVLKKNSQYRFTFLEDFT